MLNVTNYLSSSSLEPEVKSQTSLTKAPSVSGPLIIRALRRDHLARSSPNYTN